MPPMKQINATDRVLQTIQDNTAAAIKGLETATQVTLTAGAESIRDISAPFTGGNLLTGVTVITTGTLISHRLGRQPQIWVLADNTVNSVVWRSAWTTDTITLHCTADTIVSIWVA